MATKKKSLSSLVSLIIPAYKQENTIQKDLLRAKKVMDETGYNYEIILVVDGELDKTFERAKKVSSSRIKVVGYPHNHGKGYAVRFGMANSKGDVIAFLDAGMDINPTGISILLDYFKWYNADVIVGSKLHPLSKVIYPWQRKVLSWGYRSLVKILFGLSLSDTQVGMKLFKRQVLEDVLPRLLVKRYAFDIEILAVANRLGYTKIYEAPIELTFSNWSSITSGNFWNPILRMLWDTCAVFYRLRILRYYDNENSRKWRYDPELNFRINID